MELSGDVFTAVIFQLGFGGLTGFAVGYALKKLLKLALIVAGLIVITVIYLQWKGIITVNYDKLVSAIEGFFKSMAVEASSIYSNIVANLPFAGAFIVGLILGLKAG
ncbi:MAG TPA: hypothetical protein ENF75_03500 [Acidilobales archaeon]|nr:MAG: hypothetical protein DRO18_07455 [Thermoprotei archaeon]HDD26135.1 hypothetical protein [Acidilobales archaeon]